MRVLVLRPEELLDETLEMLKANGFDAHGCPFVRLRYLDFDVPDHDYAIVTSQNAAKVVCRRGLKLNNVIAIGKRTASILRAKYKVLVPTRFDSETLVREFADMLRGKRVVAIRSNAGNDTLKKLSRICEYSEVVAYEIEMLRGDEQLKTAEKAKHGFYDVVVLSSSMIAENFLSLCNGEVKAKIVAIGPPTAKVVERFGLKALVPDEYTFEGVLNLLRTLKDADSRY